MKKTSTKPATLLIAWTILAPLLLYLGYHLYHQRWSALPVFSTGALHFRLINQEGKIVDSRDGEGHIRVAAFFFTRCPVTCPQMISNLKKIATAPATDGILIYTFSVDPATDHPAELKKYALRRGINTLKWNLLTGPKKKIYLLARNGFRVVATDGDGGESDFIHSDKLILVDRKATIRGYYNGTSVTETDQLIRDIKKLKDEN